MKWSSSPSSSSFTSFFRRSTFFSAWLPPYSLETRLSLAYGTTAFTIAAINNIWVTYNYEYFLRGPLNHSSSFILVQAIFLLWNSINDPLFGWISDHTTLMQQKKHDDDPYSALTRKRSLWTKLKFQLGLDEAAYYSTPTHTTTTTTLHSHSTTALPPLYLHPCARRIIPIKLGGWCLCLSFLFAWFPWSSSSLFLSSVHFLLSLCMYDAALSWLEVNYSSLLADIHSSEHIRSKCNMASSLFSILGSLSSFFAAMIYTHQQEQQHATTVTASATAANMHIRTESDAHVGQTAADSHYGNGGGSGDSDSDNVFVSHSLFNFRLFCFAVVIIAIPFFEYTTKYIVRLAEQLQQKEHATESQQQQQQHVHIQMTTITALANRQQTEDLSSSSSFTSSAPSSSSTSSSSSATVDAADAQLTIRTNAHEQQFQTQSTPAHGSSAITLTSMSMSMSMEGAHAPLLDSLSKSTGTLSQQTDESTSKKKLSSSSSSSSSTSSAAAAALSYSSFFGQLLSHRNYVLFCGIRLLQVFSCTFEKNHLSLFLTLLCAQSLSASSRGLLISSSFILPHALLLLLSSTLLGRLGLHKIILLLFATKVALATAIALGSWYFPWNLFDNPSPASAASATTAHGTDSLSFLSMIPPFFIVFYLCTSRVVTECVCRLFPLVISQLVDEDRVVHGRSRSMAASLIGTSALLAKPGESLAPMLGWYVLQLTSQNSPATSASGSLADETSSSMKAVTSTTALWILLCLPLLAACIQLLLWSFWTLKGKKLKEMNEKIKQMDLEEENAYDTNK